MATHWFNPATDMERTAGASIAPMPLLTKRSRLIDANSGGS